MVHVLEDKQDAIADVCRRFGVSRLYVFGSSLREDFRPGDSDVDLLVEFAPMEPYALAHAYFDMLDELQSLLGVEVDLVMVDAVKNPYVSREIERTKQPLYAA